MSTEVKDILCPECGSRVLLVEWVDVNDELHSRKVCSNYGGCELSV
jgi:DNA-directed RNA polymerase subunit RPC12/RpoP